MKICKESTLCTGCGACEAICPTESVLMKENNEGFLYPEIDKKRCIKCNMCQKVCPVNQEKINRKPLKAYVARNKEKEVLLESTSGGVGTAIADYFLQNKGWVYGVVYDDTMKPIHVGTKNPKDVSRMKGSKYVQSYAGLLFKKIKLQLQKEERVCFFGTPCQVAGLRSYLGKDYDNLLLIDLVCHGVSSPSAFKGYIKFLECKYSKKVVDVKFRNKTYGYHSSTMKAIFEDDTTYMASGRIDPMAKGYFSGAFSRTSCYQCPFKGLDRQGDITLFDSWNVDLVTGRKLDDDLGFTNIFVNSLKGKSIIDELYLQIYEGNMERMLKFDGSMITNNPEAHKFRQKILEMIKQQRFDEVLTTYLKNSPKDYFIEAIKGVCYKTQILQLVRAVKNGYQNKGKEN